MNDEIYNFQPISRYKIKVTIRDVRPAQFHFITDDEELLQWESNDLGTTAGPGLDHASASGGNAACTKLNALTPAATVESAVSRIIAVR